MPATLPSEAVADAVLRAWRARQDLHIDPSDRTALVVPEAVIAELGPPDSAFDQFAAPRSQGCGCRGRGMSIGTHCKPGRRFKLFGRRYDDNFEVEEVPVRQLDRVLAIHKDDRRARWGSRIIRQWPLHGATAAVSSSLEIVILTDADYVVVDDIDALATALYSAAEYAKRVAVSTVDAALPNWRARPSGDSVRDREEGTRASR
jgi:hypothetical protein